MNQIITEQYPFFRLYQRLRGHLMASLSDADLAFTPGGDNATLGRLCVEIGQTQQSYIDSFRTFALDFDYRHAEADKLAGSVGRLTAWFEALDDDLHAAVASLSDDDIDNHPIDRGGGFMIPAGIQFEIYKEALIIFYAKCSVYLKLMDITPSEQWHEWMG